MVCESAAARCGFDDDGGGLGDGDGGFDGCRDVIICGGCFDGSGGVMKIAQLTVEVYRDWV